MESELTELAVASHVESVASPIEFPCSVAQERFWLLDRLEPGNPAYSVAVRWRLEGSISTSLLEQAWLTIIERHEVLRTVFPERDGGPVQHVLAASSFKLTEIDLTDLPVESRESECDRIGLLEARTPFDLRTGPLLRATLVRLSANAAVLLVTTHQAVSDGWSIGIMAREMGLIYQALTGGRPPELPQLAIQYGDYALWQLEWQRERGTATEESYWVKHLAGVRPFQVVPDRPRPAVPTTNGAIASSVLPRELTNAAQALSADCGTTLFAAALAALCATLSRYTGEPEVVLGTQVSGRDQVELELMIGQFVNSLVLRNDLSDDPTFAELVKRVHGTTTEAIEYRHISIERLLALVKAERTGTDSAPISVNFIFQRSFIQNATYGALTLIDMPSLPAGAIYDLNLFMVERPDGWRFSCQYNTDQFEAETAERLLRYCESALASGTAEPHLRVSQLRLGAELDSGVLLAKLGSTDDYPRELTLAQLFSARAQATPAAVAVQCGGDSLTYRELDTAAARVASCLQREGIAAASRVAIYLERSVNWVAAILAVLKAGGAYVLLDPADPPKSVLEHLRTSGAVAVITRAPLVDALAGIQLKRVDLDSALAAPGETVQFSAVATAASAPACVTYVPSGRAGLDALPIPHRALVNLLWSLRRRLALSERDVFLATASPMLDSVHVQIWLPLSSGARLTLAEVTDGERQLLRTVMRSGATIIAAIAPVLSTLVEAGWKPQARLKILCDGAEIGKKLAEQLSERGELWCLQAWPHAGGGWSVLHGVDWSRSTTGEPVANTRFLILDRAGGAAPIGATGELWLEGEGLASPAERLRTGEVVRLRADGVIEKLGRTDRRFRTHGRLIEPAAIEAALLADPTVREAVVVGRKGQEPGSRDITAYVCWHEPAGASTRRDELEQHLREVLPAYAIPSLVQLASLPQTPAGQIAFAALQRPLGTGPEGGAGPSSELERRLAGIWASLLGMATVDTTANFFELGGHSLLAARMLARIEAELGRRITLNALFREPTIRGLARTLQTESRTFDFRQVVKLQPHGARRMLIAINNTGVYYLLAKRLGADQPFTSLQLFDPSARTQCLPDSLEELAAAYVELIRRVEPRSPYLLMGWCAAGALTFEIARQLVGAGETVSGLFLVDSWVPHYFQRLPWLKGLIGEYTLRLQILGADLRLWLTRQYTFGHFMDKRALVQKLRRLRKSVAAVPRGAEFVQTDPEHYDIWLLEYLQRVTSKYEPALYSGKIVLFRSKREPTGCWFDPLAGWGRFAAGGVELIMVDGDHMTMFQDPGAMQMAEHMRRALDTMRDEPAAGRPRTHA